MRRNYRYRKNLNFFSDVLFTLMGDDRNRRFIAFNVSFLIDNVDKNPF